MKKHIHIFVAISLVAVVATNVSAQVKAATLSSIPVNDFAEKSYTLEVVNSLAVKYRVVIGAYGTIPVADKADNKTIDISIKNGTLGDALDAITKADPQWEWHQTGGGPIHFVSRRAALSLMGVTVHSFDVDNPESWEVFDRLEGTPAVHSWLRRHKCPLNAANLNTGGNPKPWRPFSVHAKDLPVSSILDQIAAQSHWYYWSVVRYGPGPCGIVMTWRDPGP